MRPARSSRGPRFPIHSVATKMALAILVLSIVAALGPDGLLALLALNPGRVIEALAIWQPFTYVFLAAEPFGVLFGALITWQMGSALEQSWGPRRLLWFGVGSTVAAGALTVLLAFFWPPLRHTPFVGATVLATALWVAYGLSHGRAPLNFWGLPLNGNQFALVGVGFVFLQGAFSRPRFLTAVAEIFVLLLTYGYVRGFSPRILWLRLQNWRLQRRLRGRSKHLKLISRERNTPDDSDHYLH